MHDHECVFVEEQEPSGRLVLPPCIVCGVTAMDALGKVEQKARDAMDDLTLVQQDLAGERDALARELAEREGWTGYHNRLIAEREELGDLLGELAYEGRIRGHGDPGAELEDPTGTLGRLNQALGLLSPQFPKGRWARNE